MGKSAQFPLHVWLPDAMEGPTPVSALIHAATMVNAGVYLVARANPLFAYAPDGDGRRRRDRHLHRDPGGVDRDDPDRHQARPRVLDAVSQLGYMFAALGVGAFTAAIFHLMTHGFFKGLLFLGSGSVIHAVHEEQDMRRMGGLVEEDPDHLRDDAHRLARDRRASRRWPASSRRTRSSARRSSSASRGSGRSASSSPCLTAFYMFRLMGLTFWGAFRGPKEVWDRIHESPPVMTIPLILLAIPSVFLGLVLGLPLGASRITSGSSRSSQRRSSCSATPRPTYQLFGIDGALILASVAVAAIGIVLAWRLFGIELGRPASAGPARARSASSTGPGCRSCTARRSTSGGSTTSTTCCSSSSAGGSRTRCWWFDREVVDGTVNAIGGGTIDGRARAAPGPDRPGPELRARASPSA